MGALKSLVKTMTWRQFAAEGDLSGWQVGRTHWYTWQMIHVQGGMKQIANGTRPHHATQNATQLKAYDLFVADIFDDIFLSNGLL